MSLLRELTFALRFTVDFLLGFLHVHQVRQANNQGGDEETDHDSNHQLGLVAVLRLICCKDKTETSDMTQHETPAWVHAKSPKRRSHFVP